MESVRFWEGETTLTKSRVPLTVRLTRRGRVPPSLALTDGRTLTLRAAHDWVYASASEQLPVLSHLDLIIDQSGMFSQQCVDLEQI